MATNPEPNRRTRFLASSLLRGESAPWLVAGAVVVLTLAATAFISETIADRDRARFQNAVQATLDRVNDRMQAYIAALRGGVALFQASMEVTRSEFVAYVDALELEQRYQGIQGIGYARRVPPSDVALEEAAMTRDHGWPVSITPSHPRAEYYPIVYLEPMDARNRAAVGYDMFTDSTRREAMERARDSGRPALSGKVELVQEIDPSSVQARSAEPRIPAPAHGRRCGAVALFAASQEVMRAEFVLYVEGPALQRRPRRICGIGETRRAETMGQGGRSRRVVCRIGNTATPAGS